MKKYISIFILFICLGCKLIVDIDVPFEHADLTVNSIFNPDSVWSASVSLNRHILDDTPFKKIDNAVVVVYEDGVPIETLTSKGEGRYRSAIGKPLPGKTYEIRASADNFQTVNGRSQVPPVVAIIHGELTSSSSSQSEPATHSIKIKFLDPPQQKNYYHILAIARGFHTDPVSGETFTFTYPIGIHSDDPSIEGDEEEYDRYQGLFTKDILFEGKEIELSFKSNDWNLTSTNEVVVILRSLSEDYYRYKTTLQLQDETSGDPFAQPVNVHDNIEGGFGIFAGYSQSIFVHHNPVPVITDFGPKQGRPGDHVIITGENFIDGNNSAFVAFNGLYGAQMLRVTNNEIEVVVPFSATTGKITIGLGNRTVSTVEDFVVLN